MTASSAEPQSVEVAQAAELAQLRAELARSQQQLERMAAAQQEFLHAVAHDLRAPLRHVTSYAGLVREVLSDLPAPVLASDSVQEALGFVQTMEQSARRIAQMIDGLQALTQVSRAPLRPVRVHLADALAQARAALAPAEAGRTVQWQLAADLPLWEADAAQLQQLLQQLLGNALKFTRHSAQPRIDIAVAQVPALAQGAPLWSLRIADNGTGFDPERAAALGNVFQRLHREADFEGLGLGLALSRAIAQRHGGTLTLTATPGVGCTVCVLWPVVSPAP